MVKNHLQRISAPMSWRLERKNNKFVTRVDSGAHPINNSVSINTLLKEMIRVTSSTKETKFVLNNKYILINGKPIHDIHYCVGLMDIISITKSKQNYRVLLDSKRKLIFVNVDDQNKRVLKINNKSIIKDKKQMLHLHGGLNLLNDSQCNIGDSILFEDNVMKKIIHIKEGSYIMLTGGKNIGRFGKVVRIFEDSNIHMIEVESDKEKFITLKEFSYVLGENKSEIKVI